MYFDELDLEDEVLDGLEAMNFFETTPVQEATIPLLLDRRDMIACAQTGTGKTAARTASPGSSSVGVWPSVPRSSSLLQGDS